MALSFYDTGVTAAYGDKLISLSTCEYSRTNNRLVVVAKKIGGAPDG
jgi:sortase B